MSQVIKAQGWGRHRFYLIERGGFYHYVHISNKKEVINLGADKAEAEIDYQQQVMEVMHGSPL